jgi:hypothetical protein
MERSNRICCATKYAAIDTAAANSSTGHRQRTNKFVMRSGSVDPSIRIAQSNKKPLVRSARAAL